MQDIYHQPYQGVWAGGSTQCASKRPEFTMPVMIGLAEDPAEKGFRVFAGLGLIESIGCIGFREFREFREFRV